MSSAPITPTYDETGRLCCDYCGIAMSNDFGFIAGEWYCTTEWCRSIWFRR